MLGVQAQTREPREQAADRGVGLEAREVHPDADVRPAREGQVAGGVGALDVEAVRIRERLGVAVGGRDRDADEVAAAIAAPPSSTSRVA